jgi:hypothetical protein
MGSELGQTHFKAGMREQLVGATEVALTAQRLKLHLPTLNTSSLSI